MIPFPVERRHQLVEREEDGEQSFGMETSDVGVEAMEVEGV